MASPPNRSSIFWFAAVFIISGVCQPIIMSVCKHAGLANPNAQLYMFFYYLGPSALVLTLLHDHNKQDGQPAVGRCRGSCPSKRAVLRAGVVSLFDMFSQALNYTGAGLAGATIFAVIYTSVTIWIALWSRLILGRSLNLKQWFAILVVFGGLTITAVHSAEMGSDVRKGAFFVAVGSAMHGAYYVLSEGIMNYGNPSDRLHVRQNASIQGLVACSVLGLWQLLYTLPRKSSIIIEPARSAGTTCLEAILIFLSFSLASLVHLWALYFTIKHFPGGATSAGVMKGLQAVLVFAATHVLFCGRSGGEEMCFSASKLLSLVTVVIGVILFGWATPNRDETATYDQVTVTSENNDETASSSTDENQQIV